MPELQPWIGLGCKILEQMNEHTSRAAANASTTKEFDDIMEEVNSSTGGLPQRLWTQKMHFDSLYRKHCDAV